MPQNAFQSYGTTTYKNHNTLKALVAITPSGAISFVSKLYGGNISDRQLTIDSGLLDLLEPSDSVMADRGFTIEDLLHTPEVWDLNKDGPQLSEDDLILTRRIATLRIHIERAIGRIKTFRILKDMPINMATLSEQIFFVCAILTKPLC